MSEIQDQNTLKSKKYFVAVQQMQYFEIEVEEQDETKATQATDLNNPKLINLL